MIYRIKIRPEAKKTLVSLPNDIKEAVTKAVDRLARQPHPLTGCKKMKGYERLFRIVVRKFYRVVYDVDVGDQTILVVRIGHRKDVYRGI